MSKAGSVRVLWLAVLLSFAFPAVISAQATTPVSQGKLNPWPHDGGHDFDFEVGTWKALVRKLVHTLTGSREWDDLDGTVVTRTLPKLEGWNESEMKVESHNSYAYRDSCRAPVQPFNEAVEHLWLQHYNGNI